MIKNIFFFLVVSNALMGNLIEDGDSCDLLFSDLMGKRNYINIPLNIGPEGVIEKVRDAFGYSSGKISIFFNGKRLSEEDNDMKMFFGYDDTTGRCLGQEVRVFKQL